MSEAAECKICWWKSRQFEEYELFQLQCWPGTRSLGKVGSVGTCCFLGGATIKNLPAKLGEARDPVQSLGQEGPLEEEMATHSSIVPGESHGQRSLAGYSPWGHRE